MAERIRSGSWKLPSPRPDMRLCILHGTDEMRKREYLEALQQMLRQQHGTFHTVVFPGATAELAEVLDEVRTASLLEPFKLVLVDEADQFLKRSGHREALERYAEAPLDQALLVLRAVNWHPGRLDKLVQKRGAVVRCDPLPPQAVPGWLIQRAKSAYGCQLEPAAARSLAEQMGTDLLRLDSELAKLAAAAGPKGRIDRQAVQELVGRSSDEKAWAIQSAVLEALESRERLVPMAAGRLLLEKLHELVELAGNDEVPVQYAVADLMRKLTYAAILRQQGMTDPQIAQALGLWGPARQAILNASRRLPADKVRRWFDRAMELDLRSRSGLGESLRNLECFCAALADEI